MKIFFKIIKKMKNRIVKLEVVIWRTLESLLPIQDRVITFDPSIDTDNMGDYIIRYYCDKALEKCIDTSKVYRVRTHTLPPKNELNKLFRAKYKIMYGTNIITSHFEWFTNWKIPSNLRGYKNIITLGVGWEYYYESISPMSRYIYKRILSSNGIHSVRDSYTEKKFHEMGIHNVINTGCPTMWLLDAEHCKNIPIYKKENVITTLTDYRRDIESDEKLLEILKGLYKKVYIWIQGKDDQEYLKSLKNVSDIEIIDSKIESYAHVLETGNVDYVGTRLHAGIYALNYKVRTIIIAVDNRAEEMGKDFNLPVISRRDIGVRLEDMINCELKINIRLPIDNINSWKKQF